VLKRVWIDCVKKESLAFTVFASGFQEAYTNLRPPIDAISYLRPVIAALYLFIAARFFAAAVDRRKPMVFGMVLLAALVTTGGDFLSLVAYGKWKIEHSSCSEQIASGKPALNRAAESVLKIFARGLEGADQSELWDASIRAEGRTLIFIHRFKIPMVNMDAFNRGAAIEQRAKLDMYC
jgi:hypothetical protein